ncbi:MAG: aminoglycoside phosphotransferase family protein [Myxacorys californica WJT36-NPBG1]|jgi:Ser/Thr protein kinase RdoA (MazF antagonist)|nr:aminoglycoside phosphotransferase family protein [Myxacorys californica WJT36-NPBG1]
MTHHQTTDQTPVGQSSNCLSAVGVAKLQRIAAQFSSGADITAVEAFGSGNINDTFLVTVKNISQPRFVLQRINTHVFRQPQLVMQNMSIFTCHVRDRLQRSPLARRWEVPRVLLTHEGDDHWIESDESVWRAISFIEGSESFDAMHDVDHAREVGYALGTFHSLISDLPPDQLADTLEGFHITPRYLQHYEQVLATTTVNLSSEVTYGLQFVRDRAEWCSVLEHAKAGGKLPLRLMHGDPKVNNVMFDCSTGKAVSVIDLDTVKPGLVHYDIGDCLRSGCNPIGEETEQWETVYFEPDLCQGILQGYLSVAKAFLTNHDYDYLFDAIRLIAFELGLRFLTDHLAGNVYFKVKHRDHNLMRALVQFQLTQSIESQETVIRSLIAEMR